MNPDERKVKNLRARDADCAADDGGRYNIHGLRTRKDNSRIFVKINEWIKVSIKLYVSTRYKSCINRFVTHSLEAYCLLEASVLQQLTIR